MLVSQPFTRYICLNQSHHVSRNPADLRTCKGPMRTPHAETRSAALSPGCRLPEGRSRARRRRAAGPEVRKISSELVWSLFVVPPNAATKRRFEVGRALSLAEAREKAQELRRQIREGKDPTAQRQAVRARSLAARDGVGTLEAVIDSYYTVGPGASLRTGIVQRKSIKRVFKPLLKRVAVEVSRADVQLQADAYKSASSASAAIGALRPMLKWAAKRNLVKDDNWRDLERPEIRLDPQVNPVGRAGRRRLSAHELTQLWPRLQGPYADASKLVLYTAVRLREATGATWSEIDLERAIWTIPAGRRKDTRSKRRVKAAPAADHVIPLSRQAVALLRILHERHKSGAVGLVLVGPEGGELVNWSRWLARIHATSGVNPWSAHALRRTAATFCAELGTPPHVVQAILGHRAIGGDLQSLYQGSRYLPEHAAALQRLADRIDAIVAGRDKILTLQAGGRNAV